MSQWQRRHPTQFSNQTNHKCGFSQFSPELVFTAAATTIKTVRRLKTTENKLLITRHYIYANCKYKFRCVLNFNLFALLFNRRYLKIIRMGIFRCIVGSDEWNAVLMLNGRALIINSDFWKNARRLKCQFLMKFVKIYSHCFVMKW